MWTDESKLPNLSRFYFKNFAIRMLSTANESYLNLKITEEPNKEKNQAIIRIVVSNNLIPSGVRREATVRPIVIYHGEVSDTVQI